MKHYKKLFFDFDDTLLDFKAAEKVALPKVFEQYGFPLTEEVKATYKTINRGLWDALERGEVSREQLLSRRFQETFAVYGIQVDGKEADEAYREFLKETIVLIEGADVVIEQLAKDYELYIVTNGISDTQFARLNASPLKGKFQEVFVSEQTGYQKPQIEFFNYVFDRIGPYELDECLLIGDSFSADIVGGHNAKMDTCWLNPTNSQPTSAIQPTYTIQKLGQLVEILYA